VKQYELLAKAQDFASTTGGLLNATICDGRPITAVNTGVDGLVRVGHGLNAKNLIAEPIPLGIGKGKTRAWLTVSYTLRADDDPRYMAVESSVYALAADEASEHIVFHYDYERGKRDDYPDAHLQIPLDKHRAWKRLSRACGVDRDFAKLHLPVGGTRYRPTLEDVIRFVIREKLVDPRPDYMSAIERSETEWFRHQLRAAVRRDPETARLALEEFDK